MEEFARMTPSGKTICLSMIVKNEAAVIRRCLTSVLKLIDHWVIVDTGSSDGTQELIRTHLAAIPGELHERPWHNFGHNRDEALELARPHGTYTLIIDADDTIDVPPGLVLPDLDADSYVLDILDNAVRYRRTQLVRNALPWRWRGVLHEFLACEGAGPSGHLNLLMRRNHDGARRRDPATYARDAEILATALAGETDPFLRARYSFYLAQSYRDCGQRKLALAHYLQRAQLGFWVEEQYVSLVQAARLMEALHFADQQIIDLYLRAASLVPRRAEALHGAARLCRLRGRNMEGARIARGGLDLPTPEDGLFVEPWIHEYGLLDEFAVNAYWSGQYRECAEASLKALASGKVPANEVARLAGNARFGLERLPAYSRDTAVERLSGTDGSS